MVKAVELMLHDDQEMHHRERIRCIAVDHTLMLPFVPAKTSDAEKYPDK